MPGLVRWLGTGRRRSFGGGRNGRLSLSGASSRGYLRLLGKFGLPFGSHITFAGRLGGIGNLAAGGRLNRFIGCAGSATATATAPATTTAIVGASGRWWQIQVGLFVWHKFAVKDDRLPGKCKAEIILTF